MNNYNSNIALGIKNKIFSNYIMSSNNTIFNSGKYSGKTFKDVYDNYPEYVNFISTHKYLKNPIFSSFNEYVMKRKQKNIINKKLNKVIGKKIKEYETGEIIFNNGK